VVGLKRMWIVGVVVVVLLCGAAAFFLLRCKVTEDTGDEVTVFGDSIPIEKMAEIINTINYEIVCLVGKRVPRIYIKENKIYKIINFIM
jgi:hypothetical protein